MGKRRGLGNAEPNGTSRRSRTDSSTSKTRSLTSTRVDRVTDTRVGGVFAARALGGVDDFHVTVVYLGKDVDDDTFAAVCERARQAAALVPGPLEGTVSGVGAFPPSDSSDGKVPAWAAVAIPGAEVLRNALADLSASEHKDWTPHVTLAYLDPGDPLPAPLEPVPVTFACLSVHRGDDVVRFPFGR